MTGQEQVKETAEVQPVLSRAMDCAAQMWCGVIHGHHEVLQFNGKQMHLLCTSCGHVSPGWVTDGASPVRKYDGDPDRHILTPLKSKSAV